MSNIIAPIPVSDLHIIEHEGQRVITLAMMDQAHGRPDGTARRAFNAHKSKLTEGHHYFVRNPSEAAKELGTIAPNGLNLLTERGYLVLVKSFTDDLAWQVQEQLVDGYFRSKAIAPPKQFTIIELLEMQIEAQKQLQIMAPKAAAHDAFENGAGLYQIREAWRVLKIREDTLTEWLVDAGWAYRDREGGRLKVCKPAEAAGVVAFKRFATINNDGTVNEGKPLVCITDRGFNIISEHFAKENIRQGNLFSISQFKHGNPGTSGGLESAA